MKKAKKILALLLALLVVMSCSMTAFAATEFTEEEINDTYNKANPMGIASKIKAVLDTATDVDYFSFEVTNPCLITVNIEHAAVTGGVSTYFTVDIINANGEDVLTFKSKGEEAKTSSAPFAAEKGTYYAAVSMGQSHSATLEYTLSATIDTAANTEKEPNDDASKASAMALSTANVKKQYYGTIANKDDPASAEIEVDVDYYSLDIPAAGAIYFYLYNGTSNKGNYKATLYAYLDGANAQPVAKSLGSINITANEESIISPSVGVNAGNYLLKIEGVNGDVGGYQARVYYLADDNSEYEYNNVKEYANQIKTTGGVYFGSTFDKADVDYYRFYVNSSNGGVKVKLAVNPSYKNIEGQWTVSLIAPNKSVIKKFDATNAKAAEFETDMLEAGTYYICVEAGNVASDGLYELSVKEKAAPPAPPKDDNDKDDSFIGQIAGLPWKDFIDNFITWLPSVNVFGMLTSLFGSFIEVFTNLWANS